MTSYDLQKICRTCLVYENKLFSLNEAQAQERMCLLDSGRSTSSKTLGEMLMECTNVEVSFDRAEYHEIHFDDKKISFTCSSRLTMDCRKMCACNAFVHSEPLLSIKACVKKVMSN